jgi:hypothetical protein
MTNEGNDHGQDNHTTVTDDLDGSKDALTYSFSWQAAEYIVDLSTQHFTALETFLKPYLEAGEEVRRPASSAHRTTSSDRHFTGAD